MPNNIFLKSSGVAMPDKNGHPFPDKYGATAEAVLTDCLPTEDIADAPVDELAAFISPKSRGRIPAPGQATYLPRKTAQDSCRLDECLYEPLTAPVGCSPDCTSAFEKGLKVISDAIQGAVRGG